MAEEVAEGREQSSCLKTLVDDLGDFLQTKKQEHEEQAQPERSLSKRATAIEQSGTR